MSRRHPGHAIVPALVFVAVVGLAAVVHLWIVSGGRWTFETNPSGTLYQRQAAAFRAGQLALLDLPPAELLALPDPYDPRQWRTLPVEIDVSLFRDRYYLYFGPLPALVLTAATTLGLGAVDDGMVGLWFDLAWLALLPVTFTTLRRRLAPDGSWLVDLAAVVSLAFAAPVGIILGRLATYETAILAGQTFLLLAVVLAGSARGPRSWLLCGGAGLALGLAAASRLTLLPALVVLIGVLALLQPGHRRRAFVALSVPFLAVLAGLALFNLARFGSPIESGWQYQLTALPQRAWLGQMFSPANLPATISWYLVRPPILGWSLPFLLPHQADPAEAIQLAAWFQEPLGMIGIVWTAPLVLLGVLAAILLVIRGKLSPVVAGFWVAALAAALPVLLFRGVLFRYQLDFLPLLVIAATTAIQVVLPHSRARRTAWTAVGLGAAALSLLFGVAGGIAMRNSRAGFSEADGLVAVMARRVPAVDAVGQALAWIGETTGRPTTALIADPLPVTPVTIDIGSPPAVDVVAASAVDPCWPLFPETAVEYRLAEPAGSDALAVFEPRLPIAGLSIPVGPTVAVSPHRTATPPLVHVSRETPVSLCPIAADAGVASTYGARHFRQFRTRAFRSSGAAIYQPVTVSGTLALRLLAHGAFDRGVPPRLTVELRRSPDGEAIARQSLAIDHDWAYAPFDVRLPAEGTVYPVLRFDGPEPRGPWWAVAVASVEAWSPGG